jgi:hypothetical protein
MRSTRLNTILVALILSLTLTACSPRALGSRINQLQSLLPGNSAVVDTNALAISAPAGSLEASVQQVILKGNLEQQEAIANRDSSVMRDTSTDAYFQQLDSTNRAMVAQGIHSIALLSIEWGDVTVTGPSAAATTWETWRTDYADGGSDQSRDKNLYTLVASGDSWKIETNEHPDDFAVPATSIAPSVAVAPSPDAPTAPISPRGRGQSSNWSGYAANTGTFTGVSGTWVVPESAGDVPSGANATWVGIGGERSRDLIQAGTEASTFTNGRVRYNAWVEMLPDVSRPVPLNVHPGDSVTVSIDQQEPGSWLIAMTNNTTGGTYNRTVQYQSSLSSAEWIQEAPSAGRGLIPLDNFGAVTFTDAWVTKDGKAMRMAQAEASPITMINGRGQPIATTSPMTGDGAGFTVMRTENPAVISAGGTPRRRGGS